MSKVLIAGGGAAGMMAAISAAEKGNRVELYEKNEKGGATLPMPLISKNFSRLL